MSIGLTYEELGRKVKELEIQLYESCKFDAKRFDTASWFDNTTDLQLLVRLDAAGEFRVMDVNKAYIETARSFSRHVTKAQITGHSIRTIALDILGFDRSVLELTIRNYRKAAKTCRPVLYEEQIDIGQKSYYFENIMVPIRDKNGGPCRHIMWSARDITKRKHAEQQSIKRNRELQALYDLQRQLGVSLKLGKTLDAAFKITLELLDMDMGGIYLLSKEQRHLDLKYHYGLSDAFNHSIKRIELRSSISGEAIRSGDVVVIKADEHPNASLKGVIKEEGFVTALSIPIRSGDKILGAMNLASFHEVRFSDSDLNLMRSIGSTVGVYVENAQLYEQLKMSTENLEAKVLERTAELEIAQKELYRVLSETKIAKALTDKKAQELESFSYSVSHDLKAPLRAIDGYSQILEEEFQDCLNSQGARLLKKVRQSAGQMNRLIEDLLNYSRLDQMNLQEQDVHIDKLVAELLDDRAQVLENKRMRTEVRFEAQTVKVADQALRHILSNLIDNAIKFSRKIEDAFIRIELTAARGEWILKISDNGMGFDMKYHDRIFRMFHRLEKTEDYPGTGVGLAIAKKMADRIHGRIWASSIPGEISHFFVAFPKKSGRTT